MPEFTHVSAHKTVQEGHEWRVQACVFPHYNHAHPQKVIGLTEDADINVVTNPGEDQLIDGLDTTSVRELIEANVNDWIGHDISKMFYPFSGVGLLQAAWWVTNVVGFNTTASWETVIGHITYHPAKTLRRSDYGLALRTSADLTVRRESSARELLRLRTPRRYVLKNEVVAESTFEESVSDQ